MSSEINKKAIVSFLLLAMESGEKANAWEEDWIVRPEAHYEDYMIQFINVYSSLQDNTNLGNLSDKENINPFIELIRNEEILSRLQYPMFNSLKVEKVEELIIQPGKHTSLELIRNEEILSKLQYPMFNELAVQKVDELITQPGEHTQQEYPLAQSFLDTFDKLELNYRIQPEPNELGVAYVAVFTVAVHNVAVATSVAALAVAVTVVLAVGKKHNNFNLLDKINLPPVINLPDVIPDMIRPDEINGSDSVLGL